MTKRDIWFFILQLTFFDILQVFFCKKHFQK